MKTGLVYVHAMTPLHPGTGQALDVIDLPVARERATDLPYAPGSSLKGVLRDRLRQHEAVRTLFGPGTGDQASEHAGAVAFGDARLLLFPVRSVTRLFCWVTSPYLVRRFLRDRTDVGLEPLVEIEELRELGVTDRSVRVSDDSVLSRVGAAARVFLDDADLPGTPSDALKRLAEGLAAELLDEAWRADLPERLVVVSDGQMRAFVTQATEVVARIKLDEDRGTVTKDKGNLWYEEALPTETVLYSAVYCEQSRRAGEQRSAQDHWDALAGVPSVQLGGKASVGRGLCRLAWVGSGDGEGR